MSATAIKCVVVGDGSVGKTSVLFTYKGAFAEHFVPTVFDSYSVTIIVDNKTGTLGYSRSRRI